MPYKDPKKQREYQRQWTQARKEAWLSENGPCKQCGSAEDLQVDHIDPTDKVAHRVWSWSDDRRAAELKKCQVLCKRCHQEKSAEAAAKGEDHSKVKLRTVDVIEMRYLSTLGVRNKTLGVRNKTLAEIFGVSKQAVCDILKKRKWKHLTDGDEEE